MLQIIQIPTTAVLHAIASVYLLIIAISILIFAFKRYQPSKDFTELTKRIKTFWIIITLLAISLFLIPRLAIIFWAIVSYLALKEYFTIIPTRFSDRRVLFWSYIVIIPQYYWIAIGWYGMFSIFIPVYFFLFLPLRMVLLGDTKGFLRSVATIQWGTMMMLYCMSYIAALYLLPAAKNPAGGTAGLIFYLLFLNQFNDAAQFFWGKTCGRHKIIPSVSPNKTVEGFIGGVITTSIFAVILAPYLTPLHRGAALFLGLIIGIAGFIGDVIMSALKRDLGIKDTSQMLPGHGGILDRIDSLLFTAPIYFHFLNYFYY